MPDVAAYVPQPYSSTQLAEIGVIHSTAADRLILWKPVAGELWERDPDTPDVDVTDLDTEAEFTDRGLTDVSSAIPQVDELPTVGDESEGG